MKNFINQKDMRLSNMIDVLTLVRDSGRITRRGIAAVTGMSWGAVSTITAQLIEEKYLIEYKDEADRTPEKGAGRTPSYLEINPDEHFAIGLDINSSGLSAVLTNLKDDVINRWSAEADFSSKGALLSGIFELTEKVLSYVGNLGEVGEHHVCCIGIAMQGIVNAKDGVSVSIRQCADWKEVPLAQMLSDRFDIPVHIEHDPNCILYASSTPNDEDTVLIRIDNGIGMAVILDGRIINKPGVFEIGHTTVSQGGDVCSCGRRGCLELYASKRGISNLSGKKFSLLVEDARTGDEDALRYFDSVAKHLAFAISNVTHLLNIKRVLLCGDMCKCRDLFEEELISKTKYYSGGDGLEISFTDVSLAPLGAARIAIERSMKQLSI